jgi:hypothetical protein
VSTNKHEFSLGRPATATTNSRFSFQNRQSETTAAQPPPIEPAQFWMGDWRLAIAEERVAMAEERLAQAQERWAKALDRV